MRECYETLKMCDEFSILAIKFCTLSLFCTIIKTNLNLNHEKQTPTYYFLPTIYAHLRSKNDNDEQRKTQR